LDNEIHNPYAGIASYVGLAPLMIQGKNTPMIQGKNTPIQGKNTPIQGKNTQIQGKIRGKFAPMRETLPPSWLGLGSTKSFFRHILWCDQTFSGFCEYLVLR